jgi:hypothetical protein
MIIETLKGLYDRNHDCQGVAVLKKEVIDRHNNQNRNGKRDDKDLKGQYL